MEDLEYQKVLNYILQLIKDGELIVGSKIPSERELAEQLGIGRNTTREAISILRGMGLVESRRGSGNYISKDLGNSIRQMMSVLLAMHTITKSDILEFRRGLSYMVIDSALRKGLSRDRQEELSAILEKMKTAAPDEQVPLDYAFHAQLIESTENPLLITLFGPITELYLESITGAVGNADEEVQKELLDLHTKIFDALVRKDRQACYQYYNEHFDLVGRFLTETSR